ncbi:antirestriction protein [Serratia liquefaciens]|uniref:antirestriction protein n=1 Tax=Serratia liquefaciens TaxID=614 RepID=UPI0022BA05E2|nr:antirestriction protein [Serratia liquefaciens]
MQYVKTHPVLNVEESDRLSLLPHLFGDDFMLLELQVYALARKHLPEYGSGFCHFIRLSEGGGYMMPDGDRFLLVNSENWFDRAVSADAAGIIPTAMAINRRCEIHHDCANAALTHLFMLRESQLWCFIDTHPEREAIYAALE